MNDRFELGKVKRSTVGNGGISIWPVRSAGVSRCIARGSAAKFFLQKIFCANRTEDFGGRETACYHALNV